MGILLCVAFSSTADSYTAGQGTTAVFFGTRMVYHSFHTTCSSRTLTGNERVCTCDTYMRARGNLLSARSLNAMSNKLILIACIEPKLSDAFFKCSEYESNINCSILIKTFGTPQTANLSGGKRCAACLQAKRYALLRTIRSQIN
jgi:hypothetical protein